MLIKQPAVKSILKGIVLWAPLWIGATVVCGGLGGVYAFLLKEDVFLASQAILVRDEANASVMKMGRFESQTQMKAAQETILELSKNRQVIREALTAVGPLKKGWLSKLSLSSSKFPDDKTVDDFAIHNVLVHAPRGVEFGATEVIYLDVKTGAPDYAHKLVLAVCDSLDARLRQVRETRANSVISELEAAKLVAKEELEKTSERIRQMESEAGAQLSDLRGLTENTGSGAPRTQIDQIMSEIRNAQAALDQLLADQRLLDEALANPTAYVVAPGSLLNSQPGLKKLREGLADAQLNTSELRGKFTDAHPLVIAANEAQTTIERRLYNSLEASRTNLQQDIDTSKNRIAELERQKELAEERLDSLANIRTKYSNLVSELKTRTTILEETERQLSQASASKESASKVSLITKLDKPLVSDKPIGPGRLTITGLCAVGGLLLGLGFVFAVTPIDGKARFGRRWSDRMSGDQRAANTDNEAELKVDEPIEPKSAAEKALELRMAVDRMPGHASKVANRKTTLITSEQDVRKFLEDEAVYKEASDNVERAHTAAAKSVPAPQVTPTTSSSTTPAASTASQTTSSQNRGQTILERLAKAQEAFEEQRATTKPLQADDAVGAVESNPSQDDRRSRRRDTDQHPSAVRAAYRNS